MIPRAISSVFQAINQKPGWRYRVHVTFSEIYNEALYDLLDPGQKDRPIEQWTKVQLLEGDDGNLHVRNLRVFEVQNEEAALALLFLGATNRRTSATVSNEVRILFMQTTCSLCHSFCRHTCFSTSRRRLLDHMPFSR
jgi:kinesin family protein 6/9